MPDAILSSVKKLALFLLIGLIVTAPAGYARQNLPASEVVKLQCKQAQTYLENTLRPNDLRGRVNRLQVYEYLYLHLNAIATRLQNNNQSGAQQLGNAVAEYRRAIDAFVKDYETYDNSRDQLASLEDCQKNISDFQKALSDMRENRAVVAKDVIKLRVAMNSGISPQLLALQETLQTAGGIKND